MLTGGLGIVLFRPVPIPISLLMSSGMKLKQGDRRRDAFEKNNKGKKDFILKKKKKGRKRNRKE